MARVLGAVAHDARLALGADARAGGGRPRLPRLARVVVAIRLERAVRRRLALALLLATLLPRPLVEALASAGAHFWLACDRRQLFSPTTGAHKSHLAFVAVVEYVALFLAHASARRHRVVEAAVRKAAERPWSFQAVRLAARLADERRWPRWTRAYPGLVRRELKFAAAAASPFAAFRRALLPSVTLAFVLADAFDAFAARREVSRRRVRRRLLGGELEDGAAETPDEPSDHQTRGDVQTSSPSSPAASPPSPSPSPSSSPSSSPSRARRSARPPRVGGLASRFAETSETFRRAARVAFDSRAFAAPFGFGAEDDRDARFISRRFSRATPAGAEERLGPDLVVQRRHTVVSPDGARLDVWSVAVADAESATVAFVAAEARRALALGGARSAAAGEAEAEAEAEARPPGVCGSRRRRRGGGGARRGAGRAFAMAIARKLREEGGRGSRSSRGRRRDARGDERSRAEPSGASVAALLKLFVTSSSCQVGVA